MRLSELKTGEKGVIIKVLGHGGFRKRIVEMGFIKGKTVEVLLNAPLKDPVKYKVMGYEISLRHQEADMIEVISEEEARAMIKPSFHAPLTEEIPLTEEQLKEAAQGKRRTINVALVGNPNCGKTSLFNIASGAHEHVGNYSGVTVDAKEGFVAVSGWQETTTVNSVEFCKKLRDSGVSTVIYTDISKDGAMQGTNRELYKELSEKYTMDIVASGGVSSIDDVVELKKEDE